MKKLIILFPFLLACGILSAQSGPAIGELPERFDTLAAVIIVNHFPSPVYASTPANQKFKYYWKHTTSVFSPEVEITIDAFGAYIYYNDQWNLRAAYDRKQFSKWFDCKNGILIPGQPYTFPQNWRTDNRLNGGWAMWYFIGSAPDGKKVYGLGKLHTVGTTYTDSDQKQ